MPKPSERNQQVLLDSRPTGWVTPENFRLVEGELPVPDEGQVLVRNRWLSLDPYMRGRISDAKSYAQGVAPGDVMVGGTVGEVLAGTCLGEIGEERMRSVTDEEDGGIVLIYDIALTGARFERVGGVCYDEHRR